MQCYAPSAHSAERCQLDIIHLKAERNKAQLQQHLHRLIAFGFTCWQPVMPLVLCLLRLTITSSPNCPLSHLPRLAGLVCYESSLYLANISCECFRSRNPKALTVGLTQPKAQPQPDLASLLSLMHKSILLPQLEVYCQLSIAFLTDNISGLHPPSKPSLRLSLPIKLSLVIPLSLFITRSLPLAELLPSTHLPFISVVFC